MIHTIIGAMSLTGTTIVLLYLILYLLAKKYFPVKWRYQVLKIALFFFLFPLGFFKYDIETFIQFLIPSMKVSVLESEIDYANTVMSNGKDTFIPVNIKIRLGIMVVIGVVALNIIAVQLFQYFKLKKMLPLWSTDISEKLNTEICTYKKKVNVKSNVRFVISDTIKVPSTLGVIQPIVFIPKAVIQEFDEIDLELIICHELLHIKHRDLLVKFIALFALTINWFNPVSYFVFYEICKMSEIYCDSKIVDKKEEEIVKRYCNLLIDIAASEKYTFRNRWTSGLVNNDMKMIKGRIMEMKNKRKRLSIVSVCMLGVFLLAGTSTVFAYEPPKQVISKDKSIDIEDMVDSKEDESLTFFTEKTIDDEMAFGDFFKDSNGTLVEVTSENESNERHVHSWRTGEIVRHIKNGKGCIVEYYEGRRCSICGHSEMFYLITSANYTVCIH